MTDSSTRVEEHLRRWMASAPPGSRLPSSRALVAHLHVSPVTVQSAVGRLAALGLVESRPGAGTFLRGTGPRTASDHRWQTAALALTGGEPRGLPAALRPAAEGRIALHAAYPEPDLLPRRLLQSAWSRVGRTESALRRPPAAGLPELRSWFAQAIGGSAGTGAPSSTDVTIVPGSQSGLAATFGALVGAGRPILMESPTYWGAILAARHIGARIVAVPTGPQGPDPDQVRMAFEETGARTFYAQPAWANPTGSCWAPDRARAIMEIVRSRGAFLIEDDYARDFGIAPGPEPLAADDPDGHVVHLRSLTKSVSPSVRVAAVIARGPARARIQGACQAESMYVSAALQEVAMEVVTRPAWKTHLRHLRGELEQRRDAMVQAVHQHIPEARLETIPTGGLHLWLQLPELGDMPDFIAACEARGVVVAGGDEWFPAEPAGSHLRLSYSGPQPEEHPEAVRRIGEALRERLEAQG
ncbi:PLP-dependent aminotransferase family protein [Nesterenkonia sp. HG001]|uniref:aminotransferase-like domain-containing protein n=1 Tax=Nesterenkonia sp. HG001 TaxID=2983207 RepID=UPI002AC7B219|nr:PLP-dependent aminotransferase family protein [Nesterenkonia sp. HG001]MDZ5077585.1 PLP-dependent aminotransferase family protein [Nesterenkonia sp. HG001]